MEGFPLPTRTKQEYRYRQASTCSLFPGKFKFSDAFSPLVGKNSAYTIVKRLFDSCHLKNQIFHILPKSILQFSVKKKSFKLHSLQYKKCSTTCTPSRSKATLSPVFTHLFLDVTPTWSTSGLQQHGIFFFF